MRLSAHVLILFGSLCFVSSAPAQTGIYAEFTGAKVPAANTNWMFGPTVGFYHDTGHGLVALGYDVRGSFLSRGGSSTPNSDERLTTLMGGVRLAITPHILPIKPYVEALGGYGHMRAGEGSPRVDSGNAGYQLLAGADLTFFPRLDWRVFEFSYGHIAGLGDSFAPKSYSTGLVLRLP